MHCRKELGLPSDITIPELTVVDAEPDPDSDEATNVHWSGVAAKGQAKQPTAWQKSVEDTAKVGVTLGGGFGRGVGRLVAAGGNAVLSAASKGIQASGN